jgi:hypothetical protein
MEVGHHAIVNLCEPSPVPRLEVLYQGSNKVLNIYLPRGTDANSEIARRIFSDCNQVLKGHRCTLVNADDQNEAPTARLFLSMGPAEAPRGRVTPIRTEYNARKDWRRSGPRPIPGHAPHRSPNSLHLPLERRWGRAPPRGSRLSASYDSALHSYARTPETASSDEKFSHLSAGDPDTDPEVEVEMETSPPELYRPGRGTAKEVITLGDCAGDLPESPSSQDSVSGVIAPPTHTGRKLSQAELIMKAAMAVAHTLQNTRAQPPDFASTTPAGLKKIKNFIHNNSKLWLKNGDIAIFNQLLGDYMSDAPRA